MAETASDRVIEIVARRLNVEVATVKPESSLRDNLGADSLDVVDVVMALEEAFGIEISDDEMEMLNTVADVIRVVGQKVGG